MRRYAEHNPKASSALLLAGTAASCATIVAFVELRDRYAHAARGRGAAGAPGAAPERSAATPGEAHLAAMLENARESSWRQNLENAADAQGRFMVPGREPAEAPAYVRRIEERSEEILRRDEERKARVKEQEKDPTKTRFWG